MKNSLFLLITISYCLISYAAGSERLAHAVPGSRARPGDPPPYVFVNSNAPGFCMGVAGGSTEPGAYVKQGKCRPELDQFWIPERIGNTNYYHVKNAKNRRMCLGVEHGSRDLRANIRQGICNDNPDQKWSFPVAAVGKQDPAVVNFKNTFGLCVGVERENEGRAQLKQNKCTGARDQAWIRWFVKLPRK